MSFRENPVDGRCAAGPARTPTSHISTVGRSGSRLIDSLRVDDDLLDFTAVDLGMLEDDLTSDNRLGVKEAGEVVERPSERRAPGIRVIRSPSSPSERLSYVCGETRGNSQPLLKAPGHSRKRRGDRSHEQASKRVIPQPQRRSGHDRSRRADITVCRRRWFSIVVAHRSCRANVPRQSPCCELLGLGRRTG